MKNVWASKKEMILHHLVTQEGYFLVKDLTRIFKISQRTLYYIFESLNQELRAKKLDPIQNLRRTGYYLKKATKEKLREEPLRNSISTGMSPVIKLSGNERCIMILVRSMVSDSKITLNSLAEIQNVSRNTVLADIHRIRQWLEEYGLLFQSDPSKGYQVRGDEEDLRWWFYEFLEHQWSFVNKLINHVSIEWEQKKKWVTDWLEDVEKLTGKFFSDDTIHLLSLFIPVVLKRIDEGHFLQSTELSEAYVLWNDAEYAMVKQLLRLYGMYGKTYERELSYLEALLLSSQINDIRPSSDYAPQRFTGFDNEVKQVIKRFQYISGIRFDRSKELKNDLYVHLLACYYRVKYGVKYRNRLLNQIKKNYSSVFSFTKYAIRSFEDFCQCTVGEDEIALIFLYFAAELGHQRKRLQEMAEVPQVLLVCGSGIRTANILKQKLQSIFPFVAFSGPMTERDYLKSHEINESVIISTIELPQKNRKVVTVHAIPDQQDLNRVAGALVPFHRFRSRFVASILDVVSEYATVTDFSSLEQGLLQLFSTPVLNLEAGGDQPMLSELLTEETVQIIENPGMSWQEAIRKSANPLLKNGWIASQYIDAMIDVVNEHGPFINIGRHVALAHARPEQGVKHLGMSLLKLDKPVYLVNGQHPVTLLFTLAAIDDTAHLKALSELATLLGEEEKLEKLLNTRTKEQLLLIISEGESK